MCGAGFADRLKPADRSKTGVNQPASQPELQYYRDTILAVGSIGTAGFDQTNLRFPVLLRRPAA
jgi:hypothetical protein